MPTLASIQTRVIGTLDPMDPDDMPEILYHYTDQAGAIGILRSRELWLTHLRFMNDNREMDHGISIFEEAIERARKGSKLGPQDEPFHTWLGPYGVIFAASLGAYAASFSEKGDDLSQWRAYCPRGGYAIGVDPEELARRMQRAGTAQLGKVVYDPLLQAAIADSLVNTAADVWREIMQSTRSSARPRALKELAAVVEYAVLTCIQLFKDPAFATEAEWRLVAAGDSIDPAETKFRPGASMIVPYATLPFLRRNDPMLRRIIVGPSPNPDLTHEGIGICLDDSGYKGYELRRSDVPYRTW